MGISKDWRQYGKTVVWNLWEPQKINELSNHRFLLWRSKCRGKNTVSSGRKPSSMDARLLRFYWKPSIGLWSSMTRTSAGYIKWRLSVLERDRYACIQCGSTMNLHVDHIKPFSKFPRLRTKLSNGRTLCMKCHHNLETLREYRNLPSYMGDPYFRTAVSVSRRDSDRLQAYRREHGVSVSFLFRKFLQEFFQETLKP